MSLLYLSSTSKCDGRGNIVISASASLKVNLQYSQGQKRAPGSHGKSCGLRSEDPWTAAVQFIFCEWDQGAGQTLGAQYTRGRDWANSFIFLNDAVEPNENTFYEIGRERGYLKDS
jgi:hypothetical protein